MIKKALLTIAALFTGPILILITMLFYNWSMVGGFCTMAIISFSAIQMVWFPDKSKTEADNGEN